MRLSIHDTYTSYHESVMHQVSQESLRHENKITGENANDEVPLTLPLPPKSRRYIRCHEMACSMTAGSLTGAGGP